MLGNQSLYARRALGVLSLVGLLMAVQAIAVTPASAVSHHIELEPKSGPAGSQVRVDGSGFLAGITVRLCWDRSGCTNLGTTTPGLDGSFSTTVIIPIDAPLGPHRIYACQRVDPLPSVICADAGFEVEETSSQPDPTTTTTTTTTIPTTTIPTTTIPTTTTTVPSSPTSTTTTTTPNGGSPTPPPPSTTEPGQTPAPPGANGVASNDPDQPDGTTTTADRQEQGSAPGEGDELQPGVEGDEEEETGLAIPGRPPSGPRDSAGVPESSDPAAEVLSQELIEAAELSVSPEPGWTLRSPLVLVAAWMASMVGAGLLLISSMWLAGRRRQPTA